MYKYIYDHELRSKGRERTTGREKEREKFVAKAERPRKNSACAIVLWFFVAY